MARSGGIDTRRSSDGADGTITNAVWDCGSMVLTVNVRIIAAGGGVSRSARSNNVRAVPGPKTSMVTPEVSLRTQPTRPCPVASRKTQGRSPTPWTVPVIAMRRP